LFVIVEEFNRDGRQFHNSSDSIALHTSEAMMLRVTLPLTLPEGPLKASTCKSRHLRYKGDRARERERIGPEVSEG
jgi:hypothetical protein